MAVAQLLFLIKLVNTNDFILTSDNLLLSQLQTKQPVIHSLIQSILQAVIPQILL